MDTNQLLDRFHRVLVEEIRAKRPDFVRAPFTVAEIYQDLVPYRTHRDRIGVEMNGDYEHLLLRLLSGEGDFLVLESDVARRELRSELQSPNPNTGIFRGFAAADVRLNPERLPEASAEESRSTQEDTVPVESLAPSGDEGTSQQPPVGGPSAASDVAESMDPMAAHDEPCSTPAGAHASAEDQTVACRWCREELPRREQLNYCPFCGTDVHVVPCPSCGEELEPTWRFCIACGAGVAQD